MAPIDPQLAVDAAAVYAGVKATNEAAKLPIVAPVLAAVNAHVQAFAEQRLLPALQRVLPLRDAAALAATDAAARLADVPAEQLVDPSPAIAAGVVVALQTRADEPTLRALFGELLASACRADRAGAVHLAHVEVLRGLEPADAVLFAHVCGRVHQRDVDHELFPEAPHWRERPRLVVSNASELAQEAGLTDPGRGPVALDNLKRLGLLADLVTDATGARIQLGRTLGVVLTPFGEAFARACVPGAIRTYPVVPPP